MGFLDKLLGRTKDVVGDHSDEIKGGVDKATDVVDDKTGGTHTGTLDKVDDIAGKAVDSVSDDAPSATPPAAS
jgi:hypothetical protein